MMIWDRYTRNTTYNKQKKWMEVLGGTHGKPAPEHQKNPSRIPGRLWRLKTVVTLRQQ